MTCPTHASSSLRRLCGCLACYKNRLRKLCCHLCHAGHRSHRSMHLQIRWPSSSICWGAGPELILRCNQGWPAYLASGCQKRVFETAHLLQAAPRGAPFICHRDACCKTALNSSTMHGPSGRLSLALFLYQAGCVASRSSMTQLSCTRWHKPCLKWACVRRRASRSMLACSLA